MSSPITLFLKDLTFEKVNVLRTDPLLEKEYNPFVVHRFLRNYIDCIFFLQEMNRLPFLAKRLQYEFLLHAISPKKRFSKYMKSATAESDVVCVMQYFQYSRRKAEEVSSLLSEEQHAILRQKLAVAST